MRRTLITLTTLTLALVGGACGDDTTPPVDSRPRDAAVDREVALTEASPCVPAKYTEDVSTCTHAATDYEPRKGVAGANGWPKCISDDNTWHPMVSATPSAAARTKAFITMGTKLWRNATKPTKADFLSARDDYSVDQGLASRVARRQDLSYPEVPGGDKFACQTAGVPGQYPDRCAGPAKLKPIIDDAFIKGSAETEVLTQAARIEAALLWFFYLSLSSEVWTCSFNSLGDCDSAAAYYLPEIDRAKPAGLSEYVAAIGPETHQRIFDALLGVRCWRDSDQALPATSTTLTDQIQKQLGKASLRGVALILRDRIGKLPCLTGEAQTAQVELVKVLGGLIDHALGLIDAGKAATLKAYTASPKTDAKSTADAQAVIDALVACP